MDTLIRENASAVFGLVGAFGAAALSFVGSWLLRRREYDLRLWDRILDRRIRAHEDVIAVALEMRVMVALGGVDDKGEILRAPQVLLSKEEFEKWFTQSVATVLNASTWLSTEAKREMNFLQDYLSTLHHNLSQFPSESYPRIGALIRQDFIDLSSTLEKLAFSYFERDLHRLKLSDLRQWHKYPRDETERRLGSTDLFKRWAEVQRVALRS